MAEKRMFAKSIVLSDAFLDMPMSSRCLYFTLGMLADDDGFVGSPKSIMRQCGASEDDMRVLISKRYVLAFESGVIVIKHWRINNYLRSDRYSKTTYVEELESLKLDKKGAYTEADKAPEIQAAESGIPDGIPTVYPEKNREEEIRSDQYRVEEEASAPGIKVLLSTGGYYNITDARIADLQKIFPEIDVRAELAVMAEAMRVSPNKRRTITRIETTMLNWMKNSRDRAIGQNKTAEAKAKTADGKKNSFHNFQQQNYDWDAIEKALFDQDREDVERMKRGEAQLPGGI